MLVLDRFKWIFSSLKLYWFIISFQTAMHYREVSQKIDRKENEKYEAMFSVCKPNC